MLYYYGWILVQILGETLPISSSGHVLLLHDMLQKMKGPSFVSLPLTPQLTETFDHFLHGSILVIMAYYFFERWSFLLIHFKRSWSILVKIAGFVLIVDGITVGAYYFLKHMQWQLYFPLGLGFAITALLLISSYFLKSHKNEPLSFRTACIMGLAQSVAFLPGISRLGITYFVARYAGFKASKAFELSWLIAFPIMSAAFARSLFALYHEAALVSLFDSATCLLILSATLFAYFLFKKSAHMASSNRWWIFGIYMIIPLVLLLK